jgi:hypothetical protein
LDIGAGAGPFVVFGWSPEPGTGGNLFLVARNRTLSAQLGFETSLPSRFERDDGSGFQSSVLAVSVTPCLRFQVVEACPLVRFGQLRVRGFGVDEPRSPKGLLSQAGLRLSLAQALGARLEGRVYAQAVRTLSRWAVQLNGADAFMLPPFGFSLGIDLAAFFL